MGVFSICYVKEASGGIKLGFISILLFCPFNIKH